MERIREEIEVEKFKMLIKDILSDYPNYRYFKMVEEVIKTKESRQDLMDAKILVAGKYMGQDGKVQEGYSLGSNGLSLVSAWENEETAKETMDLTRSIKSLTKWIIGLTIGYTIISFVSLIFVVVSFYKI